MKNILPISATLLFAVATAVAETTPTPGAVLLPPPPGSSATQAAPSAPPTPTSTNFGDIDTTIPQPTTTESKSVVALSNSPQLTGGTQSTATQEVRASISSPAAAPAISTLQATVAESTYPQVVRRQEGGYVAVNIPPGWKLVPLKSLQFNPAPVVKLANGEEFTVQSSPFVLIPASENTRTSINPRGLQVLHNYYLAEIELMRQLSEALRASNDVTRIE